jgi:hypothetical protein
VAVAVAVREPPSSSDSSPKNSPVAGVCRMIFWPALSFTDSSIAPSTTMNIESPGSPARNRTSPGLT